MDRKLFLMNYKQEKGCFICRERRTWVLIFHHIHPKDKLFNISDGYKSYTWREVLIELDKCIVLCANCHLDVHHWRCKDEK